MRGHPSILILVDLVNPADVRDDLIVLRRGGGAALLGGHHVVFECHCQPSELSLGRTDGSEVGSTVGSGSIVGSVLTSSGHCSSDAWMPPISRSPSTQTTTCTPEIGSAS